MPLSWLKNRVEKLDLPLVLLELRKRPKGVSRYVTLALCGAAVFFGSAYVLNAFVSSSDTKLAGSVFTYVAFGQMFIVAFVTPIDGARAIASEHEHRTFEQLSLTALSSAQIVDQKAMTAALGVVAFCLTSVPFALIALLVGAVNPLVIVGAYVLLILTAVTLSYLGVGISSLFTSASSATAIAVMSAFLGGISAPITLPLALVASLGRGAEWLMPIATAAMLSTVPALAFWCLARRYTEWMGATNAARRHGLIVPAVLVWAILTAVLARVSTSGGSPGQGAMDAAMSCTSQFAAMCMLFNLNGDTPGWGPPQRGLFALAALAGSAILWTSSAIVLRDLTIMRVDFLRTGGKAPRPRKGVGV